MYKRIFSKYFILILLFVFISRLVMAIEEKAETTMAMDSMQIEKTLIVNYKNGLLSIEAESIPVKELFKEISKKTDIESFVDSVIKDSLSIKFENIKLKEGLEKIINSIGNKNYGLVYKKRDKGELELSKIYLIEKYVGINNEELAEIIENLGEYSNSNIKSIKAYRKLDELSKEKGKEMVPFIINRLKTIDNLRTRRELSIILGKIGDTSVIPEFEKVLEDTKKYVTPYPIADMTGIGLTDGNIYGEMIEVLHKLRFKKFTDEEKPYEKSFEEQAIFWKNVYIEKYEFDGLVLEELRKLGKPAVNSLIELLKYTEGKEKYGESAIVIKLASIAKKLDYNEVFKNEIYPVLIECLKRNDNSRSAALEVLEGLENVINFKEIIVPLSETLRDSRGWVRDNASRILQKTGKDCVPQILDIYINMNIDSKKDIIKLLGNIGDERAIELLNKALRDPSLIKEAEKSLEQIKNIK